MLPGPQAHKREDEILGSVNDLTRTRQSYWTVVRYQGTRRGERLWLCGFGWSVLWRATQLYAHARPAASTAAQRQPLPRFPAVTPWLAKIECFVRARQPVALPAGADAPAAGAGASSAAAPVLRMALVEHYPLSETETGGMLKASSLATPSERRLVHVDLIDTKYVIARPAGEPGSAFFLPYANVSGMR